MSAEREEETKADTEEQREGEALRSDPLLPSADPDFVGRFAIMGKLGEGGMGVVFRARDPALDREVAIKLVHPSRTSPSSDARARLLREAQAMAKVTHPNVVSVYEVGAFGIGVFIAMELIAGITLSKWLAEHAATTRDDDDDEVKKQRQLAILDKLVQAGRGLGAAHRAGILHRDFKPENVLVGDDGRARVLDFGLARASVVDAIPTDPHDEAKGVAVGALQAPLTSFGTIVGTPSFMSPEHFRGTVTEASDQWSYCVALYRALFGRAPFRPKGDGVLALYEAVAKEPPAPPPTPHEAHLGEHVIDAIMRGLKVDPAERWPSIDALVDVLEGELHVDPAHDPRAFRRQRFVMATALVVIGIVNFVVMTALGKFGPNAKLADTISPTVLALFIIVGTAVKLRKALQRSAYNQKVFAIFILSTAVPAAHRALALHMSADIAFVLRSDAIFTIGIGLFGVLAIERWLLWLVGLMSAYLVASFLVPSLLVPLYGVALIGGAVSGVWFWRGSNVAPQPLARTRSGAFSSPSPSPSPSPALRTNRRG